MITRWYVELQIAGASAEHQELTGLQSVTCGCDSQSQLKVPRGPGTSELRLKFEPKANGVMLQRIGGGHEIEYAGQKHPSVCVPWEQDAFVGPLRICFLRSEADTSGGVSGPLGLLLGLLILAIVCGWGALAAKVGGGGPSEGPDAPALSVAAATSCPVMGKMTPVLTAEALAEAATSKMDRYAFCPGVGGEALALYFQAQECLRSSDEQGHNEALARELKLRIERTRNTLERDYAALQLSLRSARQKSNVAAVEKLADHLLLLSRLPQEHPYARWLSALRRDARDTLRNQHQ